ncbi:metalloprotease PmbA [Algiphilus sp.]|uniref:metalloprotease PmbA n=1 Tax=Algiphilus sp. TaxID=1872431 RepID=UPI0025C2D53D|nr:metalloprotease PmbA [Algiphilus sp.]MCK5771932.1 metalloprotease PmbA [Algiphilus sp.]
MSQQPASRNPDAERAADTATAEAMVARALDAARAAGADSAEAGASLSRALTVSVRNAEVESLEFQRDRDLSLTVYCGARSGSATTSDWSDDGIRGAAEAAVAIARASGEDSCNGLPDADRLATAFPDLDLFHPWMADADDAVDLARRCEAAALAADERIGQSEGATLDTGRGVAVLGNTLGFMGVSAGTRHSLSCAVIARAGDEMQRDFWYTAGRVPGALITPEAVGRRAGERAAARLGAARVATRRCPVLFPPELARGLWGALAGAASGGVLYRRASFLLDRAGTTVAAPHVHIEQQPHIPQAVGSAAFDEEGVATRPRALVEAGVLQGYLLSSYSARRLGLETTGNAGGAFNLAVRPTFDGGLEALAREMGEGLLVTELMGQGVNTVTGDYSRGAAGYLVRGGAIAEPVDEITIAGNLLDMLGDVQAIGSDVDVTSGVRSGSVLVGAMTVAGA